MKESCLVIAGEKSGEDHAMTFLPELIESLPDVQFYGVGGSRLESMNVELMYHLKDFSGIGISEVLSKIPFYYKALDEIVLQVKKRNTKTAILIDFQGFNLKLAKKLKNLGVNVLYYVAPQAWVWKPWRSKVLEKNVHTLFTILPFEKEWFRNRGVTKVKSVVHPLMIEYKNELQDIPNKNIADLDVRALKLLVLPGSRNVEVSTLKPIFERAIKLLLEDGIKIELGIVKSESVRSEHYDSDLKYQFDWASTDLAKALKWADISIAASGTVTLATGLFHLPTVVCYKVSLFTELVLNLLVPYKGPASLTNIILGKMIFPELIQYRADRYNIAKHIKEMISSPKQYDTIVEELKRTESLLTGDDFSVSDYMKNVIKNG